MIVIADTTPVHYLVLIDALDVLEKMYGRVVLPRAVRAELLHARTPDRVRNWMENPPEWIEVRAPSGTGDASLQRLGAGECEAILLAEELGCDELILDEALGRFWTRPWDAASPRRAACPSSGPLVCSERRLSAIYSICEAHLSV
jgi:predicted nucleic acid-binding protein